MRNKLKFNLSLKISAIVMLISLIGITTLSIISYKQAKEIFISHTSQLLNKNIQEYSKLINESIQKLKYNITLLSYNPSLKGFMRSYLDKYKYDEITNKTFNQYKKDITTIITLIMKQNPQYFQMRIIDAKTGKEIIKVINDQGKIKILKQKNLQNKWDKDYVQDTIKMNSSNIYISKINLNREFNTIEFPQKPTIRVATIINAKDKKAGILVINANIKKLFHLDKLKKRKDTLTFIANMEGYYLFNPLNPNKEFGFEYGKDFKIYYDFPKLKELYEGKKNEISYIDKKNDTIIRAKKVYIAPKRFIVVLKSTTTATFGKKAKEYIDNLIIAIISITLIITILTSLLVRRITNPIKQLTEIASEIAKTKGNKKIQIPVTSKDEIGELAKAFKVMLDALIESKKEIENFASKLEEEVEKKTKELQEINKNLQKMVEEKVKEIREKDKALVQQSKMAAMGEMIGAIAHQWRQPLNALAINIQMLEDMAEDGELTKEFIEEFVEKNMQTIQFMSSTIDDFRNFFRKDKEKVDFDIKEAIEKTLNLQKAQLKNHNIHIITDLQSAKIKGYKNEFMQAILNLVSNAKDAIEEKRAKENKDFEGEIIIKSKKDGENVILTIEDNGGGIPQEVMDRIFEPYFTTKEEGKGTGMGLYMVKEIIERMNGKIKAENTDKGAKFTIILKAESES
ncbi:MAG: HAMP domain-containing protein [Epsilonproteobacteria bacterium]|nr:HAMP domain-containing protein [Campylobacterota bacterium]